MDLDLDAGAALPPFASEENKQLDAEVKRKEAELERVEEKIESDSKRIKVLTDHLVNVQQELMNTQQLVDAKKHETETEEHLKALSNRQLARVKSEIVRFQKMQDDTQDRINSYSNDLLRGNEKLDQFKLEMNWNQEQLEQWAIAAKQKEEDELTLEKYKRADDAKVRELTLAIEKLQAETERKKKELDDSVTETQARQIELDKTAELFKQLHEDRKKLILQWEESVNSMKTRDRQLERLGEEYASNLARKRGKEEKLREKKKQHEEAEATNRQLEDAIQQADRTLVQLRLNHMDVKSALTGFKDEVEVLRNQLNACETEKTNTKNQHSQLLRTVDERKKKLENLQQAMQDRKKGLEDAVARSKDKEARAKEVEQARNELLQQQKAAERETKAAKEALYKESQELYKLRAEEATTLGEISGNQSAIKNLQFQISRLDAERQRQQELLYAVDFQSQLMQRKVARVSGERTVEEREEFNEKLAQLEKQLEEQKNLHGILSAQIKRQDAELKNANRSLAGMKNENESMKSSMEQLELENKNVNRSVQATVKEKEEALIQHDVLRLEVKRLRQVLNSKSENLFGLENRKQQLQISMEEREKEIEVHTEVLRAQLRAVEEERHKAALELAERKQKIFNLKSKYDNITSKVKKEDGEEGHSQAHYMIKAAQEKEELQRKGDELDDKIRRAEKEIRSLENTLAHLVTRNQKYKENFQNANQQNQNEQEEKLALEEQSRAANEVLFRKKKQLTKLEGEEQEDVKRFEELQANSERLRSTEQEMSAALEVLRQDIENQGPKQDRAEMALQASVQRATDAGVDMDEDSTPTHDVAARLLRDQNQGVLDALGNALQEHAEDVLPLFESLCAEKGISRPSRRLVSAHGSGSRLGTGRSASVTRG